MVVRVRAVVLAAGLLMVGAGCGGEGNDDLRGGVDGPVMFAPGPSTEDGQDAGIEGVLVRDGECLFVDAGEAGGRFVVLWPFGTGWDEAAQAVRLSSGETIPVGSVVSAGGGYPSVAGVQQMSTTVELSERILECVGGMTGELAHVQHSITVRAATDTESDGE